MVDTSILKNIGLTDNEIKVYLALFEIGDSLASKIGEKVNLNRTHVYDILESLLGKGIVSYVVKENRKYFKAANPNKLVDYLREKESQLKDQKSKIKSLIPDLLKLQKLQEDEGIVEIYKGKEGYKTLYYQVLREVKEYYVIGATGYFPEKLPYFYAAHEKIRIKRKISLKILFNSFYERKPIGKKVYTKGRKYADVKFLPKSFQAPVPVIIYGDKLFMMIWPIMQIVFINNKYVAQAYKNYFNALWEISKRKPSV